MVVEHINLDNTIGAAFLGVIVSAVLYGVTCLQTFNYFNRGFDDTPWFKGLIGVLWSLDTFHLILITHSMYYYLISNFSNGRALQFTTWSMLVQVYVTCVSDALIRFIYAQRIWNISGKSIIIVATIGITTLLTASSGIAFAARAHYLGTFASFSQISYLMYISLSTAVVSDIVIAATLCMSLSRSRTGFKKTDTIVNLLMMYAVNSSLVTTLCAIACLITYAIWPDEFIFISIYVSLGKLLFNSLLAMLNGRDNLRNKMAHTANFSAHTSSRGLGVELPMRSRAYDDKPDPNFALQSIRSQGKAVLINVDTHVEVASSRELGV